MSEPAQKEKFKREHVRAQVVPAHISGMLTVQTDETTDQIPFLIWDVSPKGIGLMSTKNIAVGQKVTVTVGQPYVMVLECVVSWTAPHGDDGFRCGLEVIVNEAKLMALYKEFSKGLEPVK